MSLFALVPAPWRAGLLVAATVAAIGGLTGLYLWHRHEIYQDGYEVAQQLAERERVALEAANREATRLAGETYAKTVDRLTLENQKLEDDLLEQDLAADQDPDAGRLGISAGSVHRIGAVR